MAEQAIKHSDIFEEGVFTGTIEQGKQLLEVFNGLEKGIKSLAVESTKYFAISIKTLADLEKRKEALDTIVRLEKANTEVIKQKSIVESALQKLEQEKLKTEQQVEKLEQQRAKTDAANLSLQQKLVKESEKANKERQNSIKNEKALASTYQQNVAALKKVSDRYKELVSRGREGTATGKLLKQEFDRLDGSVRKAEQSVGQFNRSVGNYKDAIKGAIQNTGLANTQLGQLIGTLGELKKKFDESSKSGGSFSDKLKIGVAGGIGIAIGALTALASVNSAVAQGFEKAFAASVGFLTGGVSGAKAAIDFKNALFESYKTLILFGLQLQKVTLDEGDFLDISNDTTIGFKERNAALQESIRLSKERARISLDIAKVELDVINKQVAAANTGIGKADPELLKKQADAQMKVTEALDVQSDLLRENAQLERKLAEERTFAAIDLLLKSKQSANARKVILEKELADEGVQLERRKKAALELAQVNTQTTNEEIRIFKEGFKVKFDSNKLVNETDAIKLKQQIESIQFLDENNKMVGIGADKQAELAKIVAKYQKENLEYLDTKKKLQEEEIKRTQKIAQITSEISIMQQADEVKTLEDAYAKLDEAIDKNFEKLLNSPFSGKLQKQRQLQLSIQKQQSQDLFDEQVKLLTQQADLDKKNIENTVKDEKIKAAEILKINEKLKIDLANLSGNQLAIDTANNDKQIEAEKKLARERLSIALDTTQQITSGIADGLQKRSELQQQADQRDIDMKNRMLDVQTALAAAGKENVLAETMAATAKAEEKKIQDAKKAAKQQEALAIIDTFTSALQTALKDDKKPFMQAFGEALAASGMVSAVFSKMFAGFYEGTTDTGTTDSPLDAKGGRVAVLHDNERVVPKRLNDQLDGISNDELVRRAVSPDLNSTFFPKIAEVQVHSYVDYQVREMTKEIKALRNDMASRPVQSNRLERLGEWTEQIQEKNVSTIIHHKKSSSRPSLRLNG